MKKIVYSMFFLMTGYFSGGNALSDRASQLDKALNKVVKTVDNLKRQYSQDNILELFCVTYQEALEALMRNPALEEWARNCCTFAAADTTNEVDQNTYMQGAINFINQMMQEAVQHNALKNSALFLMFSQESLALWNKGLSNALLSLGQTIGNELKALHESLRSEDDETQKTQKQQQAVIILRDAFKAMYGDMTSSIKQILRSQRA